MLAKKLSVDGVTFSAVNTVTLKDSYMRGLRHRSD